MPRQYVEEPQARGVRPMRVVHDERERLLLGEVRAQPEEPVQAGVRGVCDLDRHLGIEDRCAACGRAREREPAADIRNARFDVRPVRAPTRIVNSHATPAGLVGGA